MTDYLDLKQKRIEYSQTLEITLKEIINRIKGMPEIIKVILFGSFATGRRDLFTDIDLIVIMESDQGFLQRTADLYQKLKTNVDLDLLVYTPDEFERIKGGRFIRSALETGQVIYEKKRD